ncbi:MAG: 16S rRNA (uracil(1498)-N(3))-methyltransferase [candidate division Zixibacteria bacterium]|nr:16S rRNA (uracil(1498)-N(3))-methyltransferase [candidate division Zixibacteria bacterium]
MEPPVFFAPPEQLSKDVIPLSSLETHHAADVLRLRSGELAIVVDGLGNGCRGEFRLADKKHAEVVVDTRLRNFGEPSVRLTLAAGMSVGYKFDEVVDKGTQLGVSRFVPLLTERSKIKLDDPRRSKSKSERLEKVALAAMKQSRRSYRPMVALPLSLRQFLAETDDDAIKLIFHPDTSSRPLEAISFPESITRITLLVGPESGFSVTETAAAKEKGYQSVGLGKRILRTETAGPVAVALVMARLGEFR